MIASISGTIIHKALDHLVVETNGLGYKVSVTKNVIEHHQLHGAIALLTQMIVREDSQALYGFLKREELDLFGMLISVSGVGPRMALAVLSSGPVEDLKNAISRGDTAIFITISGIGKKTAERIIVELKASVQEISGAAGAHDSTDVIEALAGLGYNAYEIRGILSKIPADASLDTKIKEALKLLG